MNVSGQTIVNELTNA